jgi:O-antigen/teichoic acid export membrane protein
VKDVVFSASMARADPGLIASASRACVVLLIAVGLVSAAAAPVALPFVFGEDFAPAVPMAQLLILATIPSAVESVVGAGLLSLERPGIRSIAQVGGLVVNVAIVVVLVPVIGGEGAALATIAGYTVVATVVVVVFSRAAGLPAASCFVPRPADAVLLVSRLRRRG